MLHNDKELFKQLILLVAEDTGIEEGIIEKDYYVTMFLKSLVSKYPEIIFKGGTSLSKCYKLINRFSEDIDLSLDFDTHPSESKRKNLKRSIVATTDEFDFVLTNPDKVRSKRDYNKYIIDFPSVFDFPSLKQYLIVETSVFIRSYPSLKMTASSIVYDYLIKTNRTDLIEQFELEPFELNVQDIKRTFVDKLFALGDYYLDDKITEHSRHIYDLYKLSTVVNIDDELKELLEQVRKERSTHLACSSAQDGVDLKSLLQEIVDKNAYKDDYESITEGLLFEKVFYNEAITQYCKEYIEKEGLNFIQHKNSCCGDGSVSLGQAIVGKLS